MDAQPPPDQAAAQNDGPASLPKPQAMPRTISRLYPKELHEKEAEAIARRRKAAGLAPGGPPAYPALPAKTIGVAFSGGGIRSATFCLGFLQALARRGLLNRIDFLSTVSGGGYIGSFFGAFFARKRLAEQEADPSLAPGEAETHLKNPDSPPLRFLRENGRYLSPNGSGDMLLGAATQVRNWITLQIVLGLAVLAFFLAANLARHGLSVSPIDPLLKEYLRLPQIRRHSLWWSPYSWACLAALLFWMVPAAWATWLVPVKPEKTYGPTFFGTAAVLAIVGSLSSIGVGCGAPARYCWLGAGIALFGALAMLVYVWGVIAADWKATHLPTAGEPFKRARQSQLRRFLLARTGEGLAAVVALLLFALIDSLGQTIYALIKHAEFSDFMINFKSLTLFSMLVAAVGSAQKILNLLPQGAQGKTRRIPLGMLAGLAALAVMILWLSAINAVGHGFAWDWKIPKGDPGAIIGQAEPDADTKADAKSDSKTDDSCCPDPGKNDVSGGAAATKPAEAQERYPWIMLGALIASALLAWLISQVRVFVNLSSLQGLYAARLTRAYLGASNPRRWGAEGQAVTDAMPRDALALKDYQPHEAGGPIHLINLTINETVSGKSQVEQLDRKGLRLTLGPFGLTGGVTDHALWKPDYRSLTPISDGSGAFNIFEKDHGCVAQTEPLPLGTWVAVSGAAFSTGMGSHTSAATSFLLGFLNVRLGYWWDSGISPWERRGRTTPKLAALVAERATEFAPAYGHLTDEFTGRFHGPARRFWYLSDGGHFENTGAYELIRRRVPFIVICDDGCDPDYEFEDVANLVRKSRIDFNAEVVFFNEAEIKKWVSKDCSAHLGTIDAMRAAGRESRREREEPEAVQEIGALEGPHATLAWVYYPGEDGKPADPDSDEPGSVILIIKPSLSGDEPLDLAQYAEANPDFPQQTTADQFFDEAQWESYRKLGEHIAERLFSAKNAADHWDLGILKLLHPQAGGRHPKRATAPTLGARRHKRSTERK